MAKAYIVQAVRTAGGRRKGALSQVHPADLGANVLNAVVQGSGIDPVRIDDVIVGCVTQAGEQSFAFGRNCVLASRLPDSVPAVTIDRQCGSSQQALQFAAQAVMSGTQDMVIAAGAESMTRVPMLSNTTLHAKAGIGEGPFSRSILNRYDVAEFSQFTGAQMMADKYGFSREDMDRFALESHAKAARAIDAGAFADEITLVETPDGPFEVDEGVRRDTTLEKLASLQPLQEGGSITAGNASQMTDGASAILVVNEKALKEHSLTPLARIHHLSVSAGESMMTDRASGQSAAAEPRQCIRSAIHAICPCRPSATKVASRSAVSGAPSGAQMPRPAKPSARARSARRAFRLAGSGGLRGTRFGQDRVQLRGVRVGAQLGADRSVPHRPRHQRQRF